MLKTLPPDIHEVVFTLVTKPRRANGVASGFMGAQGSIPALGDEAAFAVLWEVFIAAKPVPVNNATAGRARVLLILRRKRIGAKLLLYLFELFVRLTLGMERLANGALVFFLIAGMNDLRLFSDGREV